MIHQDFKCDLFFIRHGESESNATPGMAAGSNYDAPLTPRGQQQAYLLGEKIKRQEWEFDRIYSSSLARTVHTTKLMLEGMGQKDRSFHKVDAIIEQQVAGWRGKPISEVMTNEVRAYMSTKGRDFVGPDGESIREVQRRATNWLEDELIYNRELASKPISLKVAIVGHGNTSRAIFQYIMGFDDRLTYRLGIGNTSISRFVFDKSGWSVLSLNDATHLDGAQDSNFEVRS